MSEDIRDMYMERERDIYYIVGIDLPKIHAKRQLVDKWELTTITEMFCANILKAEAEKTYFKLNGNGAIVIIPNDWIMWMAPSRKLWNKELDDEE